MKKPVSKTRRLSVESLEDRLCLSVSPEALFSSEINAVNNSAVVSENEANSDLVDLSGITSSENLDESQVPVVSITKIQEQLVGPDGEILRPVIIELERTIPADNPDSINQALEILYDPSIPRLVTVTMVLSDGQEMESTWYENGLVDRTTKATFMPGNTKLQLTFYVNELIDDKTNHTFFRFSLVQKSETEPTYLLGNRTCVMAGVIHTRSQDSSLFPLDDIWDSLELDRPLTNAPEATAAPFSQNSLDVPALVNTQCDTETLLTDTLYHKYDGSRGIAETVTLDIPHTVSLFGTVINDFASKVPVFHIHKAMEEMPDDFI